MNKKLAIALSAMAVVALPLTGCVETPPVSAAPGESSTSQEAKDPNRQLIIGVTVYNMSSFISAGKDGIDQYAKDNNIQIQWNSANNDVTVSNLVINIQFP